MMLKQAFILFFASTLLFSCKKENPTATITTPVVEEPAEQNLFISAKIDGVSWSVENSVNDYQHFAGHDAQLGGNGDMVLDYEAVISQIEPNPATQLPGVFVIKMSNFTHNLGDYESNDNYFNSHFTTGAKSYFVNGTAFSGAEIAYYDVNDNLWSTKFGTQTGGTFNFTSVENTTLNGTTGKLCKGTFSGKVYLETDPSTFKTITNGSFYVIFDKY